MYLGFILISLLISCSKDDEAAPKDTESKDFLEIVVNGKTYKNEIFSGGTGFGNQIGCLPGKPHFLGLLSQVETSAFFFDSYISYLENEVDFIKFSSGRYAVQAWTGNNSICNLNLGISFKDKSLTNQNTTIVSGGINTITSIKKVKTTSTTVLYQIQGNFTCSFRNNAGTTIPLTGKYQITIPTYK